MKTFWKTLATYSTKLALYAAEHPDQIAAIVSIAQSAAKK